MRYLFAFSAILVLLTAWPVVAEESSVDPDFAELCAKAIFCEGFEDLSRANFNNSNDGRDYPIALDSEVAKEGKSLRLTFDGNLPQETTGTVGWDIPDIKSGAFYVSVWMHFGDGLGTLLRSQKFGEGGGMKFMQLVAGARSCSDEEIVISDSALHSYLTGLPQLVHSCSGFPFRQGSDWQPVEGDLDDCGFQYIVDQRNAKKTPDNPACVFWEDGWNLIELRVDIGKRLTLWVNGRLTVDATETANGTIPGGPYGQVYLSNYMTGYGLWGKPMAGNEFGNGFWRIRYDNLIISRNCITSCGWSK